MKIDGFVSEGIIFVPAFVLSTDLGISESVVFEVDTGAQRTVISDRDAKKLNINYADLKPGPVALGVGGLAKTFIIEDAAILFNSGDWLLVRRMDKLEVLKHETEDPELAKAFASLPSLLGRDILGKRFTLISNGTSVTIDL